MENLREYQRLQAGADIDTVSGDRIIRESSRDLSASGIRAGQTY